MKIEETFTAEERATLEVTLPTAMELCRLGLATMIDIRQSFEIEMKGAITDTVHIPMFEVKRMLGHALTDDEQEILDANGNAGNVSWAFGLGLERLAMVLFGIPDIRYVNDSCPGTP